MRWFIALLLMSPAPACAQIVGVVCTSPDNNLSFGTGVVELYLQSGDTGTGWVLTAEHVITTAGKIEVVIDGKRSVCAIVGVNHDLDLAMLYVKSFPAKTKPVVHADRAYRGSRVMAFNFEGAVAKGVIEEVTLRELKCDEGVVIKGRVISMTCPVVSGYSGGPILNEDNEMVGITCASGESNYGVDILEVKGFIHTLLEKNTKLREALERIIEAAKRIERENKK